MDGSERRTSERVPLTLKVEYPDAGGLVHDYTENISRGGTFILTARPVELGTRLSLTLSFPGLLTPLTLSGIVRWRRDAPPEEQGIGIEFEEPPAAVRQRVEAILGGVITNDPSFVARRMRILVVDDNPLVTALISKGVARGARRGLSDRVVLDFATAADGREALAMVSRDQFDLLFIDVYMPVMDGPAVIREIRAREGARHVPIIALSVGGSEAREVALQAGADFFIGKPVRLETILATIRRLSGDGADAHS